MINLNIDFYKLHHKNEMKKIGRRNLKMTSNLNCAFQSFFMQKHVHFQV